MKIEEAILYLLAKKNGGMTTDQLADEINRSKLVVLSSGMPVSSAYVYRTVMQHPETFCKAEGRIFLMIQTMLGAIAGDLAAWTYENDRECFYSSLTSADAELSSLGEAALATALWNINHRDGGQFDCWGLGENHYLRHGARLIQVATLAQDNDYPMTLLKSDHEAFYDDKEGMYAVNIITELISGLHNGKTKTEVLADNFGQIFKDLKSSWKWQSVSEREGLLIYLMRAWDCFEKAWDFTSAIHNAARWEGAQRHLLCAITGAIAEAMYGCEYRLLKEKYGENHYNYIKYPKCIDPDIRAIHDYQFEHRVFFPKNSALTNVETHSWKCYPSKLEGKVISSQERSSILRALYTGWDNRYCCLRRR